jgi:hypothetical protein
MIRLRSIHDERAMIYEYEPEANTYTQGELRGPLRTAGVRGFADVRTIGLRRKAEVFAAIYSLGNQLHVAIPPQHFAWPGEFVAQRRSLLSRIKSFSITSPARTHVHFFYIFIDDVHEFPGPEAVDIFKMIAWKTATPEAIRETVLLWEGLFRGDDLSSSEFR